jgi:hypothetical protein
MGVGILVFNVTDEDVDDECRRAYAILRAAGFDMVPVDHPDLGTVLGRAAALLAGDTIPDAPPPDL